MYDTLISSLDELKDRVRTCWENLNQEIIGKIDHWRDQLKAVVRLNGGIIQQLFFLRSGSFAAMLFYAECSIMRSKNMRSYCHCVSSVTMVL